MMPGMILEGPNADPNVDHPNAGDPMDDPAIAAAAAAGLVPMPAMNVPGMNPRPTSLSPPLMPPGGPQPPPQPAPTAPGVGSPTNPWNVPVGYRAARSCAAADDQQPQPQPVLRTRPPQADR